MTSSERYNSVTGYSSSKSWGSQGISDVKEIFGRDSSSYSIAKPIMDDDWYGITIRGFQMFLATIKRFRRLINNEKMFKEIHKQ
jgi:hypothetical protein